VPSFFADKDFDFATRVAIGHAAVGIMDIGRVLATTARIQDGDADSWYAAWRATADAHHQEAIVRLSAGHTSSAGRLFLAASDSYDEAISFPDRMADQTLFAPTFALHRQCWEAFVDAYGDRVERIAVPYESTTLPGYLFRSDASGAPRPTLVLTNGSDGAISGMWTSGTSAALARGWNAFVYDGPGQQTMLFDHGVPFRPDWEAVLTPVVDCLIGRRDVDASALCAYGISQAGYWLARALAFEHRFVAAVVDGGVMDVGATWLSHLPPELVAALKAGYKDAFNIAMTQASNDPRTAQTLKFRGRPYGKSTVYDTYAAVLDYNLRDVIDNITTPVLIADPDNEQFFPGQPANMYASLTGDRELIHFASADGTDYHCEPLGRWSLELAMFDFFELRLANRMARM
jgi:hypothetical protein